MHLLTLTLAVDGVEHNQVVWRVNESKALEVCNAVEWSSLTTTLVTSGPKEPQRALFKYCGNVGAGRCGMLIFNSGLGATRAPVPPGVSPPVPSPIPASLPVAAPAARPGASRHLRANADVAAKDTCATAIAAANDTLDKWENELSERCRLFIQAHRSFDCQIE